MKEKMGGKKHMNAEGSRSGSGRTTPKGEIDI
jgi:hypothetical protein